MEYLERAFSFERRLGDRFILCGHTSSRGHLGVGLLVGLVAGRARGQEPSQEGAETVCHSEVV
ncbi:MAG: hypothetical protein JXA83_01080, partial [Acidimicrobiales bacterium]|nr:hypothetical protein [Acidimicrobiales bacterium]